MTKTKTEENWNLVSNETFAKGSDSWEENGKIYVRHRVASGSPDEVKKILGDVKTKAQQKLGYAHNVKVYEKVQHNPTTNGVVKEKVFCVEESDDLGDGDDSTPKNENTSTFTSSSEVPTDGLTPLQVLKNFVDNVAEDVRQQKNWVLGLGIGLGIVAAATLILYVKLF